MRKPRVLIVLHLFEIGGSERQAFYLADGLKKRGFEVMVRGFGSSSGKSMIWFRVAEIDCSTFGFREKILLNVKGFKSRLLSFIYWIRLVRLVRRLKPDVIVPFTYYPNLIFCRYWKWMGAAVCFWNQRDGGIGFSVDGRKEQSVIKLASGVISNSLRGKILLSQFYKGPITIIENGIPELNPNFKRLYNKCKRIGMLANLHKHKDHRTLILAWQFLVSEKLIDGQTLVLAGRPGDTAEELHSLCKSLKLGDTVEFLGEVLDVPGLLNDLDIGVLSSVDEGLPNGILECMAAGLPIVATQIIGSEDALGKDYPLLSRPGDYIHMAENIYRLISDESLRMELGRKNLMRLRSKFGIETMVDKYEALFYSKSERFE